MQPLYRSRLYARDPRQALERRAGGGADRSLAGRFASRPGAAAWRVPLRRRGRAQSEAAAQSARRQPRVGSARWRASPGWIRCAPWAAPAARQFARQVILAWFTDTAAYDSLTWSSDLLAARLRRCLMNSAFLETNSDALFRAHLLRSLNRQAEHLSRVLPDGLNGAALLKASIALMLAGALLPQGPKRRRQVAAQGRRAAGPRAARRRSWPMAAMSSAARR